MFSKITLGSSKTLSFILLLLIASQVSVASQGVRRRNNQDTTGFEEIDLEPCSTIRCASACTADSCSPDKFCVEHFTAGDCCPKARCSGCTPSLKAQCPDPCENYTSCGYGEVCRAIQFKDRCCPKAVCSQEVPDILAIDATNTPPSNTSCEGVVCGKDPCNCPVQDDPYCGYHCYDPFPSTDCCPTSTHGECMLWCYDAPPPLP